MEKEIVVKKFEEIKNSRKGMGIQQIWISTALKTELETLKQQIKTDFGINVSIADVISFYINKGKETN